MKPEDEKPPANAKRVYRWADLPDTTETTGFFVFEPNQEPREITVANNQLRVLLGLMASPIYAASYCRISDQVLPLRRDHGLDIECKMYSGDPETGRERYGVYFLNSRVVRASEARAAA